MIIRRYDPAFNIMIVLVWSASAALALTPPGRALGALYALVAATAYLATVAVERERLSLRLLRKVPGPHQEPRTTLARALGYYIFGEAPAFVANFGRMLDWQMDLRDAYGDTSAGFLPFWVCGARVQLSDPADVKHILRTNVNNYVKPPIFTSIFRELLADGIFNAQHGPHAADNGHNWYLQRKVAAKVFTGSNFRSFFERTFVRHGKGVVEIMRATGVAGAPEAAPDVAARGIDVQDLMYRFTLESIANIGFGVELGCMNRDVPFSRAFDRAQWLSYTRLQRPFTRALPACCSRKERALRKQIAIIDRFASDVIKARRQQRRQAQGQHAHGAGCGSDGGSGSDLLSLFLDADYSAYARKAVQDRTAGGMSARDGQHLEQLARSMPTDGFLRDLIVNFAIAGRDTTANSLTWCLFALATMPEVETALAAEIARQLRGGDPSYESVTPRRMPYLHGFVQEVFRLWPSVPYDPKFAVEEDTLPSGYRIPAGSNVLYCPYVMGRRGDLWPEPEVLRPERWMPGEGGAAVRDAFTFPVFQGGSRVCLGLSMATFEVKMLVCLMVQRFRFRLAGASAERVEKLVNVTLSVKGGLNVLLEER